MTNSPEIPHSSVLDKMHAGVDLADAGRYAEALDVYLWCWDHGNEQDSAFVGIRLSFLLSYANQLAADYAPCMRAFQERKASIQTRIDAGDIYSRGVPTTAFDDFTTLEMELRALVQFGF
jgi:hypothetical protein